MLMPTRPETLKTFEEVQKLEYIRDVIIPEAKADSTTNLDQAFHPCGTPSCLLGRAVSRKIVSPGFRSHDELGVDENEWIAIFGFAFRGTLEDRAKAIDGIIRRKLSEGT